jgi:hypothetical protein
MPLEMIGSVLDIEPNDSIAWAMFLRLLFGPERH